jgi:DDE family transposase
MRNGTPAIPTSVFGLFETLRRQLCDTEFVARNRARAQDFTRHRQLTFPILMLFILQKTIKSLQRHLHEFLDELAGGELFEPVTAGAFTHARAKLKHTAFIELNQQTVVPWFYGSERAQGLQRWRGHRLLGVDSSLLRLPNSAELRREFTLVEVENQTGHTGTSYAEARMSVVYDLLNRVCLDGRLERSTLGEVDLAVEQLRQASAGDVLINDRGFTGYRYLAWHHKLGLQHISRCSTGSFAAAQELFRMNRAGRSNVVTLKARAQEQAELEGIGLPLELAVRFLSVRLPTGELEVLVTSLLDEQAYPTGEFLEVYHRRWEHETFYKTLKGRLDLENFSGQTAEAVRQDFHATLLLCNLERILVEPTEAQMQQQSLEHKNTRQVNQAVAFHAIKEELIELFYSNTPLEHVIEKLQRLFRGCPVSARPKRKPPRLKPSMHRSHHFQRHVRKIVF